MAPVLYSKHVHCPGLQQKVNSKTGESPLSSTARRDHSPGLGSGHSLDAGTDAKRADRWGGEELIVAECGQRFSTIGRICGLDDVGFFWSIQIQHLGCLFQACCLRPIPCSLRFQLGMRSVAAVSL